MKRYTLRILLCLFLGVVTTIAVAWGIAMWSPRNSNNYVNSLNESHVSWWQSRVPSTWRETPGAIANFTSFGMDHYLYTEYSEEEFEEQRTLGNNVSRRVCGWPFRSMEGATFVDRSKSRTRLEALTFVKFRSRIYGVIPTEISLLGFVVDSLFWSVLFMLALVGVSKLHRMARKRRGRCPTCGYELHNNLDAGCPECGWDRPDAQDS